MKRKIILGLVLASTLLFNQAQSRENIRELFKNKEAIIYTINIRNFGAVDKDNNGIIETEKGDINGSFLNAKEKLNSLVKEGINTIYVLPITSVGKLKAIGTAGSLYAMNSFDTINPQLDDIDSKSVYDEAKEFVDYAHKLNLNVILDLPSCGAYDLSLNKPDWFLSDEKGESLTPADWTDVRLFKIYNSDNKLNSEMIENFKKFVDLAQNLGFDGIRADVAAIKPYAFWKNIIDYSRQKNPNFLFLAEASPSWDNPAPFGVKNYSSIQSLLDAGFDSYYGSFSDFKNIKTKAEFDKKIKENSKILSKNKDKSIIGALATHDQQAPILKNKNYWNMVLWLNCTMPMNAYFLDGFSVGDDYTYEYENKKSENSLTDDDFYYVHSGLFDIFNLTANVRNKHPEFKNEYLKGIAFKKEHSKLIKNGKFNLLKTGNDKVFGYSLENKEEKLIVVGSVDEDKNQQIVLEEKLLSKKQSFNFINGKTQPKIEKNKLKINLDINELQVYLIKKN